MKHSFFLITFFAYTNLIHSTLPLLNLVDIPTGVSLPRASYALGMSVYANGSIMSRATIGLNDNIYLGAAWDVENLIGSEEVNVSIPGVIAKIKITNGWETFPLLIAFGYDLFYTGNEGKRENQVPYNNIIFGPYISFTKPIFLFGDEQHIHFGFKMPLQPIVEPRDADFFIGFDFPIGILVPMFEINKIYLTPNRLSEILYNVGFRLNIIDNLALELNFIIGYQQKVERILGIEYANQF